MIYDYDKLLAATEINANLTLRVG